MRPPVWQSDISALLKGDRGVLQSAERFLEPQFVAVQVFDPGRAYPEGAFQMPSARVPPSATSRTTALRQQFCDRGWRALPFSPGLIAAAREPWAQRLGRGAAYVSHLRIRITAPPARAPQARADDPHEPNNRAAETAASRSTTDAQRDAHMPSTHPLHHVRGAFRWDDSRPCAWAVIEEREPGEVAGRECWRGN